MGFTFDKDFNVKEILWRSKAATSPLTGRKIACVVGLDTGGNYRGGMEVHRTKGKGERSYTKWVEVACNDFRTAEAVSREAVRDRLWFDTQLVAQRSGHKFRPGEVMAKATMDDGWSVEVREAGKLSAAEKYAIKTLGDENKAQRQNLKH